MPELPEVEILARHLAPLIKNKRIHEVDVRRARVISPTSEQELKQTLTGAKLGELTRRGKYLLFAFTRSVKKTPCILLGHLGMTGRMYLLPQESPLPKHAAVVLSLGKEKFIFEDTRYFGRFTLDTSSIQNLGPEPLGPDFTIEYFTKALKRSTQPIKVKLLDQALVAGVGNIYASEALYRAGISPRLAANKIKPPQIKRLHEAILEVLEQAIETGSTLPLNFSGSGQKDGLFYYGSAQGVSDFDQERLLVYDREGHPCYKCGDKIKRFVQSARSTFYCPRCQRH